MTPTRYLPVLGTWAYDGQPDPSEWWNPFSVFSLYLAARGLDYIEPDDPFVWDGCVDGLFTQKRHLAWQAAAANLAFRLKTLPLQDRNIIAHSHGGAVAVYASTRVRINRLVTVAMPVRKDMRPMYQACAKAAVGGWMHLYATGWSDRMQLLGQLFDGAWSLERRVLIAGVQNVGIPGGVGHSKILNDPATFGAWEQSGAIAFLTTPDLMEAA